MKVVITATVNCNEYEEFTIEAAINVPPTLKHGISAVDMNTIRRAAREQLPPGYWLWNVINEKPND